MDFAAQALLEATFVDPHCHPLQHPSQQRQGCHSWNKARHGCQCFAKRCWQGPAHQALRPKVCAPHVRLGRDKPAPGLTTQLILSQQTAPWAHSFTAGDRPSYWEQAWRQGSGDTRRQSYFCIPAAGKCYGHRPHKSSLILQADKQVQVILSKNQTASAIL